MKKEKYTLIENAQNGDKIAMETLVVENKGLVWSAVRKFANRGTDAEDIFQIGAIGLIKAIKKFNPEFNVEFSTYAVPMIFGEIRRFLRDDGLIKVSRNLKENASTIKKASEIFYQKEGRDATVSELSELTGIKKSDITLALEATQQTESIYKTIHDGENTSILLIDKIKSKDNKEDSILTSVALREAVKNLPSRERQILLLRFYKEKTQSEVAKIMGVSQVQISRIEKKLLSVLRENIG